MLGVRFLLAASLQLSLDFILVVLLLTLHIALVALLVNWPLRVCILLSSIILGIGVFCNYVGDIPLLVVGASILQVRAIYGLPLLISLILSTVSFRKVKAIFVAYNKYLLAEQKKDQIKLLELALFREKLVKQIDLDGIKVLDEATSNYLKQAIYRVRSYVRLKVRTIGIQKLVSDTSLLVKNQWMEPVPQLILKLHTKYRVLKADIGKIKQLLLNSIRYLQKHNTNNAPVHVIVEDTLLGYKFSDMPGYLKKIAAIRIILTTAQELPSLQEVYLAQEAAYHSDLSITAHQLPLLENAQVIDAHYGYLEQDKKNMHLYVVPIIVRKVRAKVMDSSRNPVAADPLELSHPLAIQLEAALLSQALEKGLDILVIHHALEVIQKYHTGVNRHSGEPFFTHPIAVALIVLEHSKNQDALIAALLHDTVEDTSLTLSHVKAMFGERVGFIVDKVTNLESKLRKTKLLSQDILVRLLYAEVEAVTLVKLADRLHNMETITGHPSIDKQKKLAKESLESYVPLAKQVKLDAIAQELEEISLEILSK